MTQLRIMRAGKWFFGATTVFGIAVLLTGILGGIVWAINGSELFHDTAFLGIVGLAVSTFSALLVLMFAEEEN